MPNSELAQKILAENEALRTDVRAHTAAMESLATRVEQAESKGKHTRWIAYGLALGLAAGGFLFLYDRQEDNTRLLELRQDYDAASCDRSNQVRAGQREQWQDVRALLIALGDNRETRRFANKLVANANENFPPLDCAPVREGKSPVPITGGTP